MNNWRQFDQGSQLADPSSASKSRIPGSPGWGIWLFGIALLIRLIFLYAYVFPADWTEIDAANWRSPGIGFGSELGSVARNLAEGRGFSSPFGVGEQPTAWFGPLVPTLWAGIFRGSGETFSQTSLSMILLSQALCSAFALVLHVSILRSLVRSVDGFPRWVILFFVLCLLFWPESLRSVKRPWYFPVQEAAMAGLVVTVIRWRENPTAGRVVSVGLLCGLVGLINPVPVVFVAGTFTYLWIRDPRNRRLLEQAAVCGGVALLVWSPWLIRNFWVFGEPVFLRSNFGVELYQGNNPDGSVSQTPASRHPALQPEELARYEQLGEIDYVHEKQQLALSYMASNPLRTAQRIAQRVYVYWLSDLLDQWQWQPQGKWWQSGAVNAGVRLIKLACAWFPLALLLLFGRWQWWRRLPLLGLCVCIMLLVPVPYYITHVQFNYSYAIRPYALILAFAVLGLWILRRQERGADTSLVRSA